MVHSELVSQESGVIEIEDGILFYESFGEGSPLLIINGGPGMHSEGFIPLAKEFSEGNTVIIYDQRGTGKSRLKEVNSETITMDKMVEDIERLREHLGYDQWHILGHSFGGMVAYAYAAKYPERFMSMIQSHSAGMSLDLRNSIDIPSRLTLKNRDSLNYYNRKLQRGDTTKATRIGRARALAPAYVYDQNQISRIAERLIQGNSKVNSLMWAHLRSEKFTVEQEMNHFIQPVLILAGRDEIVPIRIAEKANEILPNAKLIIMEQCGHYGWIDRPDIYLKEVKDFLNMYNK